MRAPLLATLLASVLVASALPAAAQDPPPTTPDDTIDTGPDYNKGEPLPLVTAPQALRAPETVGPAQAVGEVRTWPALDDLNGVIYLKDYTLRGVGENVEVWVASGLADPTPDQPGDETEALDFLDGDCRNDERVEVTDEQVAYLISEFDTNIYPKESEAFSVPPARGGGEATLPDLAGLAADYYTGDADNIVVLVDNVRDDNFYDLNNSEGFSYIAGFFFSVFNEFVDRNVMTIDGFDWLHRTTADPPNEPVPGDNCASKPARPFLYEGVFAHEYQHLLEHYEDPDETTWLNEGLSDWAQTLTGYVDPSIPITEIGFDSHVQCFLGYLGQQTPANPNPRDGGPENSLTIWQDQGPGELLCDYGAAYTFMEYLYGRYGTPFMTALHRGDADGFDGLQEALDARGVADPPLDLLHRWAAMVALDAYLDDGGWLHGGAAADYQTPTLHASVNLATENAYSTPGAPPNGSDYVRLRDRSGRPLASGQIQSIRFDGGEALPALPVEWTVDANPPGHEGNAALHSGSGPNLDRAIVHQVAVPAGNPTLQLETRYKTEEGFDFAFVQVSTDGGATYTSLGNADTTTEVDPTAIATVQDNLPGFAGNSGGGEEPAWIETTFDLTPYAGQTILLVFRYVTDSGVDRPGWWVDDVRVGGTPLADGTSLEGWRSPTLIRPVPVGGFTVQLVAYSTTRVQGRPLFPAAIYRLRLGPGATASMNRIDVIRNLTPLADTVAAIVTYDEPTGTITQYAPYTLTVNGVVQPGGSQP